METESPASAPAVVAVVVTSDPGPWFEETLLSLAGSDYPNLSVLVVDCASAEDPTPTVASVMPGAFVKRMERRVGFGTAANEVLSIVEGASQYLFCHDDVALAPDAIRLLVEEMYRSNAGVVSPKFVRWDQPDRLAAVGLTTDKVGAVRRMVEPGELDQEQHDSVRDVLVAPSGAVLIRADLFSALGGFDSVVDSQGEDIDISWRAHLAGARVLVAPAARVRHLSASTVGARAESTPSEAHIPEANRLRTVLTCYRWYNLAWIFPLALMWALGEFVTLLLRGRVAEAAMVGRAVPAAFRRPGRLREARRRVQSQRAVGDGELRYLQVKGNARLRAYLQHRFDDLRAGLGGGESAGPLVLFPGEGPDPDADGREVAPPGAGRPRRRRPLGWLLAVALVAVAVVGSRSVLGVPFPQFGRVPVASGGWTGLWRTWWSTWQPSGLGVAAPSSPALMLLGVLATVLLSAAGTAQHLVVLGPLLIGPIGAYRAARLWGARRGGLVATITYAVIPLPYNALAGEHWEGLVAYAVMPWVLAGLVRLSAVVPAPPTVTRRLLWRVAGLGAVVAVVASVAPVALYLVPLTGLALAAGSLLVGRPDGALRPLGVSAGASVVAFVMLLPWSATVIVSPVALSGARLGPAGRLGLGEVLRFHSGPYGSGAWEWLILVAAALPLVVAHSWRFEWAVRMWVVALGAFGWVWAGQRGWLPALPVEVGLSAAAAAIASSAALGAAAFEMDLPAFNFGWRQVASAVAGVCLLLAALPVFSASFGGRWDMPTADASSVLPFLPAARNGDYRVLWVGDPRALPAPGRPLSTGFAYTVSFDGEPGLADDWVTGPAGASGVLRQDLRLAQRDLTTQLGHLLGTAGVLYLVIPNHVGPSGAGGAAVPVPGDLLTGLALQTDLKALVVDPDYTVYLNAAWAPARSVPPAAADGSLATSDNRAVQGVDLTGAAPVLTGGSATRVSGQVPSGSTVYVASTSSGGWSLSAGGHTVPRSRAFGWAMSFHVPAGAAAGTPARLVYGPPFLVRAGYVLQIVLWIGVPIAVLADRRRRSGGGEVADPSWFAAEQAPVRRRRGRPSRAARSGGGRRRGAELAADVAPPLPDEGPPAFDAPPARVSLPGPEWPEDELPADDESGDPGSRGD
jgi:GT2 family glycosyltransferase